MSINKEIKDLISKAEEDKQKHEELIHVIVKVNESRKRFQEQEELNGKFRTEFDQQRDELVKSMIEDRIEAAMTADIQSKVEEQVEEISRKRDVLNKENACLMESMDKFIQKTYADACLKQSGDCFDNMASNQEMAEKNRKVRLLLMETQGQIEALNTFIEFQKSRYAARLKFVNLHTAE